MASTSEAISDSTTQAETEEGQQHTATNAFVTSTIAFPRLENVTAETIRPFLRKYDAYVRELNARAEQMLDAGVKTEAIRPVALKYCIAQDYLESLLALDFIPNASSYEDLKEVDLLDYLKKQAAPSKTNVTLDALERAVKKDLRIDMNDNDAVSRMRNVFVAYHALLRKHGVSWLTDENPKIAVKHVTSAIKPETLRIRLQSDLSFGYKHLKNDFKAFIGHCLKLSEAFQLLDVGQGPSKTSGTQKEKKADGHVGHVTANAPKKDKEKTRAPREVPVCLFEPHRSRGIRHLLKDCKDCPEEEKKGLMDKYFAERAKDGPAASTRSRQGNVGRLEKQKERNSSDLDASCPVRLADGTASMFATGRCDDGSDDTIVSPKVAEQASIDGIGKMSRIQPVVLQVALRVDDKPQQFTFSRSWTCPRVVLHLAAGQLALLNVKFLVADDDLTSGDLIIGLPVLRHLRVDTKTLLERNRASLDGTDCSDVRGISTEEQPRQVGRLIKAEPTKDNRPRANYYTFRSAEDEFENSNLIEPISENSNEDVREALEQTVKEAEENGLPDEKKLELRNLISEHSSIFCTSFSEGPPADVKPLQINLVPDARPVRVKLRNYSSEQRSFMKNIVGDLLKCKMVYPNPTSSWACAPLLVPKDGPVKFRFTVDLRPVNKFTLKHGFLMPNVEQELHSIAGSTVFAKFDLSHGYWQLPLHVDSQECQSFVTPDGVYTPTRVLHGTTNAVTYLQSTIASILPADLLPHVLYWLDDILVHHASVQGMIGAIAKLFRLFKKLNLKLHPSKCCFFATTIRWCGRLLSSDGIKFDPRRIDGIHKMQLPVTGAQLQQFVCALQWVKTAIPNFTALVDPLHRFLENVYGRANARTKRGVSKVLLSAIGWGKTESDAFHRCRTALGDQVTLAHRKQDNRLCVYTDASDAFWSGIVTQIPQADVTLPHQEKRHEPLAFLSGRFDKTQMGWSVLEKEAYAVMATLDRMHWLVSDPQGFDLHTDHNNLIYIFDPTSVVTDISQTTIRKVLRWAVRLSVYNYTCIHIKGPDNVWADLLGRWSAATPTICRLVHIPELSSTSAEDFEWPSREELYKAQQDVARDDRPSYLTSDSADGLYKTAANAIWIPDGETDLQLRLCVISHTGPAGHRGPAATLQPLQENFTWSDMEDDIHKFVRGCILCLSTQGGGSVPRPFGPAFHGTKPNDLLQFDYIELGQSGIGAKYVLMLRDDHSSYCWFFAFPDTLAENAATAIIDWSAAFGVPGALMSDGPTHFRNETLRHVAKGLRVPHHFTLPYCPWSNGAVERLGKELLRVARSLMAELQLRFDEWPDILPIIQSVLNNAPSPQRDNVAPITAFHGTEPTPPITTFYRSTTSQPVTVTTLQAERALNTQELVDKMAELHPVLNEQLMNRRKQGRDSVSRGKLPNFDVGDYVLVARADFFAGEKLALRWRGPRRIIKAVSDYIYTTEDLRNGAQDDIHVSRLKFYRDSEMDSQVVMRHVLTSETGMVVSRLLSLEELSNGLYVRVRWAGLPQDEDTMEPIAKVYEDVPQLLQRLLNRKSISAQLANKARRELGL